MGHTGKPDGLHSCTPGGQGEGESRRCTHTYRDTHRHTYMHSQTQIYTHSQTHTHIHTHMHIYTHTDTEGLFENVGCGLLSHFFINNPVFSPLLFVNMPRGQNVMGISNQQHTYYLKVQSDQPTELGAMKMKAKACHLYVWAGREAGTASYCLADRDFASNFCPNTNYFLGHLAVGGLSCSTGFK